MFNNFEEVFAQEDLPATEGQDEHSRIRHLVQQRLDLRSSHLPMIVVIEVTMHAALIATIGEIKLYIERDVKPLRLSGHFLHQPAHCRSPRKTAGSEMG